MAQARGDAPPADPREVQELRQKLAVLEAENARLREGLGVLPDALARSVEEQRAALAASERRFRMILDSVRDMVFVKNRNLTVVYANRATCQYYGMTEVQLRGLTDVPFNKRDYTEQYLQDDLHVLQSGEVVEQRREPNRRHDGVTRLFHTVKSPIAGADGTIVEVVGVAREITEQVDAEEQRRLAQNAALRAEVVTALAAADALGTSAASCCEALVKHLDLAFAGVWLLGRAEGAPRLEGRSGTAEPHPRLAEVVALALAERRLVMREVPEGFIAAHPLDVGARLVGAIGLVAARPLTDGRLSGFASIADSVAQGIERKRAEESLARRAEELARSNAELERFAYIASHDLQEPLRVVSSFAQLLARRYQGKLDKDADDYIGFLVDGVARMKRLLNDLLVYSKLMRNGPHLGRIRVGEAVEHALGKLRPAIAESRAVVRVGALPEVNADGDRLTQVMENLIGNAIKFRRPDAPPEIEVSHERRGDEWLFSVRDNGIGVEPKYFDRIFIVFQRLHTADAYPGTGIGLATCKLIIERHGGRIWIESSPGEGSTFRFTLPA